MFESYEIASILVIFLMGGMIKGAVGLGLPAFSLALMTVFFDIKLAIAILLVPSIITNIWQASSGGAFIAAWKRLWTYYITAAACVWIGTLLLITLDVRLVISLFGALLVAYSLASLTGFQLSTSPQREPFLSPILGCVNGVITGLTGICIIPSAIYFNTLGQGRNTTVQALGMLFLLLTIVMLVIFQKQDLLSISLIPTQIMATLAALTGMYIGNRLRNNISQNAFRKALFTVLAAIGVFLIIRQIV